MCCISGRGCPGALVALAGLLLSIGCTHHYRAEGVVLAVDPNAQTVTISHRAIPGYMEAMAMPFEVRNSTQLSGLRPGARVNFTLNVGRTHSDVSGIRQQATAVDDVPLPKPVGKLSVGATVPDFALTDQAGRTIQLSDFSGRPVAIDFIYTRCPLPDVCPRLSANFARLQKRFGAALILLSVTIDPQYDTPAVLTEYARRWQAGENWHFLTGPPAAVAQTAGCFGLIYWPEEGLITHTSAAGLIDRSGRLAALLEGSTYTSQQLVDLVQAALLPTQP